MRHSLPSSIIAKRIHPPYTVPTIRQQGGNPPKIDTIAQRRPQQPRRPHRVQHKLPCGTDSRGSTVQIRQFGVVRVHDDGGPADGGVDGAGREHDAATGSVPAVDGAEGVEGGEEAGADGEGNVDHYKQFKEEKKLMTRICICYSLVCFEEYTSKKVERRGKEVYFLKR